ncbi:hypothetical protein VTJ83DRAFT_5368 [Remersonia thermophila]|uniref:Protein YIP n=1 Tax=Remersonia thermophila TaxID=72144 RepID=A0ABR4D834_9PEZI
MSQYYNPPPSQGYAPAGGAQNLQFYTSNYGQPVPGHATPSQASYGYGGPSSGAYGSSSHFASGYGDPSDVSGRLGEQGGLRTGWLAAFSTEGYPGEPPLLEELGVNVGHIRQKTLAVLNPLSRPDQHLMDDSDLAGPLFFFLLYGTFLLLSGRVHFGYIYGLAVFGSILLHGILSLMAPAAESVAAGGSYAAAYAGAVPGPDGVGVGAGPTAMGGSAAAVPGGGKNGASSVGGGAGGGGGGGSLTFARSASVLGYCLLPLLATSMVGIFMPMDKPVGIALSAAAILWSTWSASGIFCAVGGMRGMRALVAYPLALFYVGFGIIAVFSSRGSGSFTKPAAGHGL